MKSQVSDKEERSKRIDFNQLNVSAVENSLQTEEGEEIKPTIFTR